MSLTLTLEKREILGKKIAKSRRGGKLPIVVYGFGHKSAPYLVDAKSFRKVWEMAGESTLVSLKEGARDFDVLIHDVSVHPITGSPLHADFLAIDVSKPVEVEVGLDFTGISPAVKNLGALLVKVMHKVETKVLPKNLVSEIVVDTSTLVNFDDKIHARNLKLPESAVLITDPEEIVVLVTEPHEEKEEEVPVDDLSAIEVEKKGKVDKETEAGAEVATKTDKPEKGEKK